MLVVVILPARREREPIIRLELRIRGHPLPPDDSAAFLIPPVVIISCQAQLGSKVVRCDRVGNMPPVRSVRYLRSADVGLCDSKRRSWLHGYLTNDGLLVNSGHGIIPTIDDKCGERHL